MKKIRKELKKWWRDIHGVGRPEQAVVVYRAGLAWAVKTLEYIRNEKTKLAQSYRENWASWKSENPPEDLQPHSLHYQTLAATFMLIGAWFTSGLEAFVAALLSQMKMDLEPVWAALVGLGIAIALTLGGKAIWAYLLGRHEDEPKRASRIVGISIAVLAPAAVILLILSILASRSEGDSYVFDQVFWLSTSVLSLVLPMLAGVLFVGAGLFGWSKKLSRVYESWEELERQIGILKEYLEQALSRFEPAIGIHSTPVVLIKPEAKEGRNIPS